MLDWYQSSQQTEFWCVFELLVDESLGASVEGLTPHDENLASVASYTEFSETDLQIVIAKDGWGLAA